MVRYIPLDNHCQLLLHSLRGEGKITDMLAEQADFVVRFQGGSNAGHTIINQYGKFALHLLPSGVFYNHTTSIIGNGVALNIPYLIKELQSLTDRNVLDRKILVSDRAQIVMSSPQFAPTIAFTIVNPPVS